MSKMKFAHMALIVRPISGTQMNHRMAEVDLIFVRLLSQMTFVSQYNLKQNFAPLKKVGYQGVSRIYLSALIYVCLVKQDLEPLVHKGTLTDSSDSEFLIVCLQQELSVSSTKNTNPLQHGYQTRNDCIL